MLDVLQKLHLLENLVLSRDSYYVNERLQDSNLEGYYESHILPQDTYFSNYPDEMNILQL